MSLAIYLVLDLVEAGDAFFLGMAMMNLINQNSPTLKNLPIAFQSVVNSTINLLKRAGAVNADINKQNSTMEDKPM